MISNTHHQGQLWNKFIFSPLGVCFLWVLWQRTTLVQTIHHKEQQYREERVDWRRLKNWVPKIVSFTPQRATMYKRKNRLNTTHFGHELRKNCSLNFLCWFSLVVFVSFGNDNKLHSSFSLKKTQTIFATKEERGTIKNFFEEYLAIFYRAVRNLVDFSLVTKLTKHVLKVLETVRKCEKTRRNDCETFFMTSGLAKMISRFLDSYFCTKFQILQPGLYPDRAIKIRHFGRKGQHRSVLFPAHSVQILLVVLGQRHNFPMQRTKSMGSKSTESFSQKMNFRKIDPRKQLPTPNTNHKGQRWYKFLLSFGCLFLMGVVSDVWTKDNFGTINFSQNDSDFPG